MKKRYHSAVKELRRSLLETYGAGLSEVIVFGSVARDTDTAESDIDVMIVLDGAIVPIDWRTEKAVRGAAFDVELKYNVVFDVKVMDLKALQSKEGHTPFIERVIAEGLRA